MRFVSFSTRRVGVSFLLLLVLVFTVSGCGKKTGSISGKVSYKGKVLPGGFVTFTSDAAGAEAKSSTIQKDGSYSVSGLPVGSAKITVQGMTARKLNLPKGMPGAKTGDVPAPEQGDVYVPPQYGSVEKSGLTCNVQAGSQEYNIELK